MGTGIIFAVILVVAIVVFIIQLSKMKKKK